MPYHTPTTRPLKIYATDPMLGRTAGNRITIQVANEPLRPGPVGSRIEVLDYDGANRCFYEPVDLDDKSILMQGGLDPTESDPRFHQQMVYAVAMKVIENFEQALGRKLYFQLQRKLRLYPHAFNGANAFFHPPPMNAVLFGHFRADRRDPGPNLPGQCVFTCLSHDIIAHEVTHALIHRQRAFFLEPSNRDVLAFHEGFSDIVAIFQHFSFQQILHEHIRRSRADLRSSAPLLELARQFGYATGGGRALRSALDTPNPRLYQTLIEPHERGSILVAAVFEAFFTAYQQRIEDLIRIATGGTGRLPEGDLHPDLVNRIASEASATAQRVLTMCIRAFEYLPPVDITYGDYLRALVTADYELNPRDEEGLRAAMIEAFRRRGVYPDSVTSLAEESLLWERVEGLKEFPVDFLGDLTIIAQEFSGSFTGLQDTRALQELARRQEKSRQEIDRLLAFARKNHQRLALDPDRLDEEHLAVRGAHLAFRVASDGQLLIEVVAQFTQEDGREKTQEELGGLSFRNGTTVIASAEGTVRYIVAKPPRLHRRAAPRRDEGEMRFDRQRAFKEEYSMVDPKAAWGETGYLSTFMATCINLTSIHRNIDR